MITRSRQDWTPGASVKVGFLTLEVVECIPTPGDYRPDDYRLPHNGLSAGWYTAQGAEIFA